MKTDSFGKIVETVGNTVDSSGKENLNLLLDLGFKVVLSAKVDCVGSVVHYYVQDDGFSISEIETNDFVCICPPDHQYVGLANAHSAFGGGSPVDVRFQQGVFVDRTEILVTGYLSSDTLIFYVLILKIA